MSKAEIQVLDSSSGQQLEFDADLSQPNTININFDVLKAGSYEVKIRIRDGHIEGSCFRLRVAPPSLQAPLQPQPMPSPTHNSISRDHKVQSSDSLVREFSSQLAISNTGDSVPYCYSTPSKSSANMTVNNFGDHAAYSMFVPPDASGIDADSALALNAHAAPFHPRLTPPPGLYIPDDFGLRLEAGAEPAEEGGPFCPDLVAELENSESQYPVLAAELQRQLGVWGKTEDRVEHLLNPTAVILNDRNGHIIVADSGHKLVKIYEQSGAMRAMIGNSDMTARLPFQDPSGLAMVVGASSRDDLVGVKCEDSLHLISYDAETASIEDSVDPSIVRSIRSTPDLRLRHLYGLAVTDDGLLVTLNQAQTGCQQTEVLIMNPHDGRLVSRFPLRPVAVRTLTGPPSKPRFIAVFHDRLIVSDLGRQKVYVVSLEDGGAELLEFGSPGRSPGQLSFVSGVGVDAGGNLLVGDAKNNRVQLFTADGAFLRVVQWKRASVPSGQVPCPFPAGIHLGRDGHLLFASRAHGSGGQVVNVYKLVVD